MQSNSVAACSICTVLVASAMAASSAKAEGVSLVTPLAIGTHVPGLGTPARELSKLLKERSGGSLRLILKEPGEGTPPFEILDKVSDGTVDAGFATAGFWAAKLPTASLFGGFPFGPDAKAYLSWFNRGNGRALYQEMYDRAQMNVHVVPCAFGGAEAGGWFNNEVSTKEDLMGLRMRIFGLGARVVMRLGVEPVLVPGSQIAQAFDENKIDAAEAYTPAVDRANGVQNAAKILYSPGWHQPATVFEFLINNERWAALGPEHQSLIESTCGELLQRTLSQSANLQAAALSALATQDGVKIVPLPEDVREALRKAWTGVAQDESARDYLFKEVFEDLAAFRSGGTEIEDGSGEAAGAGSEDAAMPPPPPPGAAMPAGP
ncbi:MAG: C4-dicarboxylate ABC transporter [Pseudomonadota bacterium]